MSAQDVACSYCGRYDWPAIEHADCNVILKQRERIADLERELAEAQAQVVGDAASISWWAAMSAKSAANAQRLETELEGARKIAEGYERTASEAVALADKAVARAERAEETIRAWQLAHEKAVTLLQDALLCRERAEASSARLREALREYGGHKGWCVSWDSVGYVNCNCNCGFDAARAAEQVPK